MNLDSLSHARVSLCDAVRPKDFLDFDLRQRAVDVATPR
jgi:hypothetical protein